MKLNWPFFPSATRKKLPVFTKNDALCDKKMHLLVRLVIQSNPDTQMFIIHTLL